MPPQDNANGAPVIPSGTEKTVYGQSSFTAQQAGQAPAAPVVNASDSSQSALQGTTFAELQAKKGFKSAEDLAKAYVELESHNKKVEMTAADIIKAVQDTAQPAPVQVQALNQAPVQNNQAANPNDAAIQIVKSIVQNEVKPLQQTVELQQLFLNNADAKEYASGIAQAVKDNPGISWASAYKLAKFDSLEQKAKESGKQEAYQSINQKQTVVAGSSAPMQRSSPDIRNIIRDRSIPFREVDRIVKETLANVGA